MSGVLEKLKEFVKAKMPASMLELGLLYCGEEACFSSLGDGEDIKSVYGKFPEEGFRLIDEGTELGIKGGLGTMTGGLNIAICNRVSNLFSEEIKKISELNMSEEMSIELHTKRHRYSLIAYELALLGGCFTEEEFATIGGNFITPEVIKICKQSEEAARAALEYLKVSYDAFQGQRK
ncbi:MAG: hypothetical protein FWB71_01940 [Defluviitaleaceae bacterium]|nr:hypothetical protein [Defluviitaleaceae bacterium]